MPIRFIDRERKRFARNPYAVTNVIDVCGNAICWMYRHTQNTAIIKVTFYGL